MRKHTNSCLETKKLQRILRTLFSSYSMTERYFTFS